MPSRTTGRLVASPAMVWALAPACRIRWKNKMATYAVDPTPDQKSSDPPISTFALGPDRMSAQLVPRPAGPVPCGRRRRRRWRLGASRTSTRTATPTATMITAATWKGRFQVAGSFCFHEASAVPLMARLATVPSAVVSTRAFSQRLRPNTSGTTATLVRVKTEADA